MATRLKDIAERVGVSISTVSLVLNGREKGRVKEASAARIREAAEDLEYRPNLLALGLKTRSSKTIGVIAEGVASIPFASEMIGGAQEAAWERGYLLLVVDIGHRREMQDTAARVLVQRNIDALILAADYPRVMSVPDIPYRPPTVTLGARPAPEADSTETIDWVLPNDEGGAHAAVRTLIENGHERIGFCTIEHPDYEAAERDRLGGYLRALEQAGIAPDDDLIMHAPGPDTVDGRNVAVRLLDLSPQPTAIFCFSDRLAMAVYQEAQSRGLSIPDDLSVIGFDNQRDVAEALRPGLTTMQLPHREMGEHAALQALSRIQEANDGTESTIASKKILCPLVQRDSVGPPRLTQPA